MAHFVRVGSDLETLVQAVFSVEFGCQWGSRLVPLCCRPDKFVICKPTHMFKPTESQQGRGCGEEPKVMVKVEQTK